MLINIKSVADELGYAIVSGIINERGRTVSFNVRLGTMLCPTCSGEDPFCATCDGNQRIYNDVSLPVVALIRWAGEGQRKYLPVGQYDEGDCTIVTTYTEPVRSFADRDILASGSEFLMRNARTVDVDDRRLVITKSLRAGNPVNRVYFICIEDEDLSTQ